MTFDVICTFHITHAEKRKIIEQYMRCMYNITLWRVRVTILRWKHKNASVYDVAAVHVTVNSTRLLSVAQQRFCGKFVTGNKTKYKYKFLKELYSNFHCLSHCL